MKFYGRSEEVCNRIIEQFETGNLPEALAPIFVNRSDNVPSSAWSWGNRFIQAIHGTADSRGFRQWESAGRKVSKGAKAIYILGPCIAKKTEQNEQGETVERTIIYGFKSIPVFPIEATEVADPKKWEAAGGVDVAEESRLERLPLREVAEAWGLKITSYNGKQGKSLGYYKPGWGIALGVENLATWAHELTHAADDRLGTIRRLSGQDPENEIVAELGGAVLLKLIGEDHQADIGGAWDYVKSYAGADKGKALRKCMKLIDRICSCVNLILKTADEMAKSDSRQAMAA